MTIALIDEVRMSNEDRHTLREQVKEVFRVSQKQVELTKKQINKYYVQWCNITRRLKTGGEMTDGLIPLRDTSKEHAFHVQANYRFMLKVFAWYDEFFRKMLTKEDEFRRARARILRILAGEEE